VTFFSNVLATKAIFYKNNQIAKNAQMNYYCKKYPLYVEKGYSIMLNSPTTIMKKIVLNFAFN